MDKNIQKYMAFAKTVEYGSFTKASKVLSYSQSGHSYLLLYAKLYKIGSKLDNSSNRKIPGYQVK